MTLEALTARGKQEQPLASPDHDKPPVRTNAIFAICHLCPQCSQMTSTYQVVRIVRSYDVQCVLMHSLGRDKCIVKQTNDVHHEYVAIPLLAFAYEMNPLCYIFSRTAINLNTIYPVLVTLSLKLQLSNPHT